MEGTIKVFSVPLISFILSGSQIVRLLPLSHAAPNLLSRLVPSYIISLGGDNYHNVPDNNANEDFVSCAVEGLVGRAIYLIVIRKQP